MRSGRCVYKLRYDAHVVCGLAHTAFEHVPDPQLTANLLHIYGSAFVGEAGIAGDHE
jgi:hypothetical protein